MFLSFSYGLVVKVFNNMNRLFVVAGAEAMFADLGHFSVRAIQVCCCMLLHTTTLFLL